MNFVVFPCAVSFVEERDVVVMTKEGVRAKSSKASASCRLSVAILVILNENSGCVVLRCLLNNTVMSHSTNHRDIHLHLW
jgi:hypothetical protein